MQGGDLYVTMMDLQDKCFTEQQTVFIAAELALALCHLHELDIAFRDLKPENVLVKENGYLKLTDFGFVKRV